MTVPELTCAYAPAKTPATGGSQGSMTPLGCKAAILVAMSTLSAGCVTVNAPAEPIVIELNINITQEVIYRLAADAGNTIEENADIF